MTRPTSTRRPATSQHTLVVLLLTAVLVLTGCGSTKEKAAGRPSDAAQPSSRSTPDVPTDPHFLSLKVGNEPYVNACAILMSTPKVISAFDKYIPANPVVMSTYAENSLPVSWYATPTDKATSTCSIQLADEPWKTFPPEISIDQYGSPALARKAFTKYRPQTQAEADALNKQNGTDLKVSPYNYGRISGLADTYYQKTSGASYTLVDNKVVTFNLGSPSVVPTATATTALRKAIPATLALLGKNPSSAERGSVDFGKHIGASLYRNPCEIFTADAFTKATGLVVDPTDVELTYNGSAATKPRRVVPQGIAASECERRSIVIGKNATAGATVEVGFFDSAAQASQQLQARRRSEQSDGSVKTVAGLGPGAYSTTDASGSYSSTTIRLAHGPYTLSVNGRAHANGESSDMPLAMLVKLAKATIANLGP